MLIFRTMAIDPTDDKPRVRDPADPAIIRANWLRARPTVPGGPPDSAFDVADVGPADPVAPTEGLSAVPDTPHHLLPHLVRKSRRPGFAVWALDANDYLARPR